MFGSTPQVTPVKDRDLPQVAQVILGFLWTLEVQYISSNLSLYVPLSMKNSSNYAFCPNSTFVCSYC